MISCIDKITHAVRHLALVLLAGFALVSCGGGGGGGSSTPDASILSGVAAVGTPIVNGTINVVCAAGSALTTTTTGSTGAWQITLSGQTLPCAVQVSGGTINGAANATPYHSIATAPGTVNVTPFTDLIVANLAGTATPSAWFAGLRNTPTPLAAIGQTQVTAALAKLSTALSGLTLLSSTNPITTVFTPTAGNVSDDMLIALATALTKTGVMYTSLLSNASVPSFAAPVAGFGTALVTAYAGTMSGGGSVVANYTVGGTVTGLTGSVMLQDSDGANLTVTANGAFTFPSGLTSGSPYNVTVLTQPSGQTCAVTGGSGTATTNVTNVVVACTNTIVPPPVCPPPQTLVNGQCVTPTPPSDTSACSTSYVLGRVLTIDTTTSIPGIPTSTNTTIQSYRAGADTTFLGQPVQQVIEQDVRDPLTVTSSIYIQDLATEWIELGRTQTWSGGSSTLSYQPPLRSPKQWAIGETVTYSGQLILPVGVGNTTTQMTITLVRRESVTVPAGTFNACLFHTDSTSSNVAGTVQGSTDTWIAPNVGEVKWVNTSGTSTITSVLRRVQ